MCSQHAQTPPPPPEPSQPGHRDPDIEVVSEPPSRQTTWQRLCALRWWQWPMGVVGELFVLLCRLWKKVATPLLPPMCRFEPTCSVYMIDAIRKRGVFVGIPMGVWRILRCNPWSEGGYDPVK